MHKPYRDDVTAQQIMEDGWARGFRVTQTLSELHAMGFNALTEADVLADWKRQNKEFDNYVEA